MNTRNLRLGAEPFRLLVEAIADYGIFLIDPAGRILSWNRGAERIKGYAEHEIVGRHFSLLYAPEDVAAGKPERELEAARRLGVIEDEGWRLRKDGSRFWANVILTALRDEKGKVYGFGKITRDLSARRKAEEVARKLAEERAARAAAEAAAARLSLLAEISRMLADATLGLEGILDAMARRCAESIGDGCALLLLCDDEPGYVVRAFHHRDPEAVRLAGEVFVGKLHERQGMSAEVMRTGEPLLIPVVDDPAALAERMNPTERRYLERFPTHSLIIVPLRTRRRIIGAMALQRSGPDRPYIPDDLSLLQDLADRGALAIENLRLLEFEVTLRQLAEGAAERSAFLAEASVILTSSLDPDVVFQKLAELSVPRIADWCAIEAKDGEEDSHLAAVAHVDPERARWARELRQSQAVDRSRPFGVFQVLRTGTPEVHSQISEELLRTRARSEAELAILGRIGARSAMIVPIAAHGQTFGAITLVWAETDRRYGDEDLRLVTEVAHRAALAVENGRLYAEVKAAVRIRDDFLAVAGHELKTPLAAHLMQLQSLERLAQKGELGGVAARLPKATHSAVRLDSLINQMLDVSRIATGRLELHPRRTDLGGVVREVVERYRDAAAKNGVGIEVDGDGEIWGLWDPLRLDQVVSNLVTNAVKYGAGKPIEVQLAAESGCGVLCVRDYGIGIAPEEQRRIFGRFERAVPATDYSGLGLGLWITRQIVEASGGTISVESEPGQGAAFTVRLPQEPEPAPAS